MQKKKGKKWSHNQNWKLDGIRIKRIRFPFSSDSASASVALISLDHKVVTILLRSLTLLVGIKLKSSLNFNSFSKIIFSDAASFGNRLSTNSSRMSLSRTRLHCQGTQYCNLDCF